MADRYWVGGTATWDASTTANWSASSGGAGGASVPGAADRVFFDANSGNVTVSIGSSNNRPCLSRDDTGFTGTFNMNATNAKVTCNGGDATSGAILTLSPSATYQYSSTAQITLAATNDNSGTPWLIKSNGKTVPILSINGSGGSFALNDDLTCTVELLTALGTFNANGHNVTIPLIVNSGTGTHSIVGGSGTWHITGTGTAVSYATVTGLTVNFTGTTISLEDTSSTAKTFAGGGLNWGTVTIAGGGSGAWTFTGSNTFANFTINGPKTIKFTNGTTTTVSNWTSVGNSGSTITLQSDSAGNQFTLSSAGTISADYMSIKDSAATGGATWYAGDHSSSVSNNSGWTFRSYVPRMALTGVG